jgi:hypothetical protein
MCRVLFAYYDSLFSRVRAVFWPESAGTSFLSRSRSFFFWPESAGTLRFQTKNLCAVALSLAGVVSESVLRGKDVHFFFLAGVVSESVLRGKDVLRPQDPLLRR